MAKKNELSENDLQAAIIYIPKEAVQLTINAHLLDPDDLQVYTAENVMTLADIKEAIIDGDYWEAENVTYKLNPNFGKENNDDEADT